MHKTVYMRHWRSLWNDKTWYHLNIYKLRPPANPVTISKGAAHISARVGSKCFVFYIQVLTKKSQKWLQQLSFVLILFSTKEIKNIKILGNYRIIIFNTKKPDWVYSAQSGFCPISFLYKSLTSLERCLPLAIFLKDCILYITAYVFWRLLIQSGFLQFSDPEVIE